MIETTEQKLPVQTGQPDNEATERQGAALGTEQANGQKDDTSLSCLNPTKEKEEKYQKGNIILSRTGNQAYIFHTQKEYDISNETPQSLVTKLKNILPPKNIAKIDIGEIEKNYTTNQMMEEVGEIEPGEEKMKMLFTKMRHKHPGKEKNGEFQKIPFCKQAGYFCCCGKSNSSKLDILGVGMVIYLKIVKSLIISFFLISLLNIPLIFFYFNNNKQKAIKEYLDALFKTTIGNIGSTLYNCYTIPSADMQKNDTITLEFDCIERVPTSVVAFGKAKDATTYSDNKANCLNFTSVFGLSIQKECDLTEVINEQMSQSCNDKDTQCSMVVNLSSLRSKCQSTIDTFFLSYTCYERFVTLYGEKKMSRNIFAFVVVGTDLLSIIVIVATLITIDICKEKDAVNFTRKKSYIREFTLHLSGYKVEKKNLLQELNDLIVHFRGLLSDEKGKELLQFSLYKKKKKKKKKKPEEEKIKESNNNLKDQNNKNNNEEEYVEEVIYDNFIDITKNKFYYSVGDYMICDIVYPIITSEKLSSIQKYDHLQEQLNEILKKPEISKKLTFDISNKKTDNSIVNNENDVVIHQPVSIEKDETLKGDYKKIKKISKEMKKLQAKIKKEQDVEIIEDFYITFRNHRIPEVIEKAYHRSKCQRCMIITCCQKKTIERYYYKGKWLNLTFAADEPSNIKWENITYSSGKRCCRSCLSLFFALIIMLITLLIIVATKYYENNLSKEYNTSIDCTYIDTDDEKKVRDEFVDEALTKQEKILSYCYCYKLMNVKNILSNELQSHTFTGYTETPCKEFIKNQVTYNIIVIGLIIIIPIINTIVIMIFRALTEYSKYKTLSTDMKSNTWKMFVIQFVNTGLLLIIVNMRIDKIRNAIPKFPLFAGSYEDIDPAWFNKVGVVILFSMILNIITPHCASIGFLLFNYCKRCCDSGCSCGKTTKVKTKHDYYSLYTGPSFALDARYASILSTFCVTMILSPGMPVLYPCFFLYISLIFLIDKWLILSYYRDPPKYDLGITEMFSDFSYFGIILHFLFGIWIYGNPFLLIDTQAGSVNSVLSKFSSVISDLVRTNANFGEEIVGRITLEHNLIIAIILILLLLYVVIKTLIVNPLRVCCCSKDVKLKKSKSNSIELGLAMKMFDFYKFYQIKQIQYYQYVKYCSPEQTALLNNLRDTLNYCRSFLSYKFYIVCDDTEIRTCVQKCLSDFDQYAQDNQETLLLEKKPILAGDQGYNLVFIPQFETAAYYEYLKNM